MLILNIDDDQEDQQIFFEALAMVDISIECICVSGVDEAIEILSRISPLPDYIFTDFEMPRVNGKEFLHYLKTHSKYQHIPVIVLSTGIRHADEAEFEKLGAIKVFSKPSTFNEMVSIIKLVVG